GLNVRRPRSTSEMRESISEGLNVRRPRLTPEMRENTQEDLSIRRKQSLLASQRTNSDDKKTD
ncbi:hypothetical protein, partial [Acinetobacter lwoffii]|uniref:hypothetical protein n=1 Tax=Acinetobacter lwoffii TaxID=28090 RepID=UPI001C869BF8